MNRRETAMPPSPPSDAAAMGDAKIADNLAAEMRVAATASQRAKQPTGAIAQMNRVLAAKDIAAAIRALDLPPALPES